MSTEMGVWGIDAMFLAFLIWYRFFIPKEIYEMYSLNYVKGIHTAKSQPSPKESQLVVAVMDHANGKVIFTETEMKNLLAACQVQVGATDAEKAELYSKPNSPWLIFENLNPVVAVPAK